MNLHEFFSLSFLKLPAERTTGEDFHNFVKLTLEQYWNALSEVDDFKIETNQDGNIIVLSKQDILQLSREIGLAIIKSLRSYYEGNTYDAYDFFKKGIDKLMPQIKYSFYKIEDTEKLYRIRKSDLDILKMKDIFHIPMSERELISSQRFSISGYPCLYFSNSTFIAWLELNKPKLNNCHVALFKVNPSKEYIDDIKLIDLTNKHPELLIQMSKGKINFNTDLARYLALWPLIFATSVKVKYREGYFKPEYIISQFLLQYIQKTRNSDIEFHGVKYSSTHYDQYSCANDFYNVAIPIYNSVDNIYCRILTGTLDFTNPISWDYLELINANYNKHSDNKYSIVINEDKQNNTEKNKEIRIVPSELIDYNLTKFGMMEQYLDSRKLHSIDVFGNQITNL